MFRMNITIIICGRLMKGEKNHASLQSYAIEIKIAMQRNQDQHIVNTYYIIKKWKGIR